MSMQDFFKKANETYEKARVLARDFAHGVEPGIYVGKLTGMVLKESQAGNPYVRRSVTITEGDHRGSSAQDNMNFNEIGLAIFINFVEMHGMSMPDELTQKSLEKICAELVEMEPQYRFRVTKKDDFSKITVLEIIASDNAGESVEEEAPAEETPTEEAAPEEQDEEVDKLRIFCDEQGIELDADSDKDAIKQKISEYLFPAPGVGAAQLKKVGFEPDASPINVDDVALLESAGLKAVIVYPEVVKPVAAPARKPLAKAPAKKGKK